MFIEAKDDGSGGDSWSYSLCKAPVKSLPPTNQHPVFYRLDALPVAQPTASKRWRENITSYGLAYPKLTWDLPTLSLATNSSWLPWGGLSCLSSALWCQYPLIYDWWPELIKEINCDPLLLEIYAGAKPVHKHPVYRMTLSSPHQIPRLFQILQIASIQLYRLPVTLVIQTDTQMLN